MAQPVESPANLSTSAAMSRGVDCTEAVSTSHDHRKRHRIIIIIIIIIINHCSINKFNNLIVLYGIEVYANTTMNHLISLRTLNNKLLRIFAAEAH